MSKTYVAALGAAMLAKAADARVDSLSADMHNGPNGYNLRAVAEFMHNHNRGRWDVGTTGKNPLNNRPFLGAAHRIDRFVKVHKGAREGYGAVCDWLRDLNARNEQEALDALVAWLRVRMTVGERSPRSGFAPGPAAGNLDALFEAVEAFMARSDGGRRAQALVAAVLACANAGRPRARVSTRHVNDPRPGDVTVLGRNDTCPVLAEVKDVAVGDEELRSLVDRAERAGVSLGLLAAFGKGQRPLDVGSARTKAAEHGVLLAVAYTPHELVEAAAVYSGTPVGAWLEEFPGKYEQYLQQLEPTGVSADEWRALVAPESP